MQIKATATQQVIDSWHEGDKEALTAWLQQQDEAMEQDGYCPHGLTTEHDWDDEHTGQVYVCLGDTY